jgi:hypothetical protein
MLYFIHLLLFSLFFISYCSVQLVGWFMFTILFKFKFLTLFSTIFMSIPVVFHFYFIMHVCVCVCDIFHHVLAFLECEVFFCVNIIAGLIFIDSLGMCGVIVYHVEAKYFMITRIIVPIYTKVLFLYNFSD